MIKDTFPLDHQIISPQQLLREVQSFTQQPIRISSNRYQDDSQSNFGNQTTKSGRQLIKRQKKANQKGLKKLIRSQKVKSLVNKFVQKLKLNNINSPPVIFQPYEEQIRQSISNIKGFDMPDIYQKILSVFIALFIIVCLFIDTTASLYPQILQYPAIKVGEYFALLVFLVQLFSSCTVVKMVQGKKVDKVSQIFMDYLVQGFAVDFAYLIILITGFFTSVGNFRLIILLKLPQCFQRIERIQNTYVNTFYKQQYWGLAKVFLLNFAFSHFLSILLVLMANLDPQNNWMGKMGIQNVPWNQQYIWGFYWGTTIMLTVGFGDISPANYQQAICLVLIQTFSCLALAYNINCVGNLISNIKSQDIQKNKNIKTFKILSSRNNISQDLQLKISNYIQQSTNIKKKFNSQEQSKFISTLPTELKADFLKESNKKIFQNLVFLKNLTQKTLLAFAQVIHMKICHPEQVVKKRGQLSGLMILKQGKLAFCTKIINSDFSNITIDQIKLQQGDDPFLLSLDFISLDHSNYQIKSQEYSILYYLSIQQTLQTLRTGEMDYQHFCFLRDRARDFNNDYQVFICEYCKNAHTKFACPKLHFTPLKKHVIDKYLHNVDISRNQRYNDFDRKKKIFKPFVIIDKNMKLVPMKVNNKDKFKINKQNQDLDQASSINQSQSKRKSFNLNLANQANVDFMKLFMMGKRQSGQNKDNKAAASGMQYQFFMDALKDQLSQLMTSKGQVWLLQCDQVKNYKFYFTQFNANTLSYNYKKSHALLKMDIL